MANIDIASSRKDNIIDLLYQTLQHTQSTELQATAECHICQEPFLSGSHPERAVKLPCGHIFGEGCILKWISRLSQSGIKIKCPLCRRSILQLKAPKRLTVQEEPTPQERSLTYSFGLAIWRILLHFLFLTCFVGLVGTGIMFYNDPCWFHFLRILGFGISINVPCYFVGNLMKQHPEMFARHNN